MSFAISCGIYNANKKEGFQYEPPPTTVIAFHWMTTLCGIVLGAGLFLFGMSFTLGLWVTVGGGVGTIIFWILYMVYFFKSDHYKMNHNALSASQLAAMWEHGAATCPYVDIHGTGYYIRTYRRNGETKRKHVSCETRPYRVDSQPHCVDGTVFYDITNEGLKRGGGYRVYTDVKYTAANEESNQYVIAAQNTALRCLQDQSDVHGETIHTKNGILGVYDLVLVTRDGKLPSFMGKNKARAAGVFFCGVVYCYQVSRIPVVRQTIYKTNVTFITNNLDYSVCSAMGKCEP